MTQMKGCFADEEMVGMVIDTYCGRRSGRS